MEIESYSFGRIVIDQETYTKDLIISPSGIKSWIRKEGHSVCIDDIKEILEERPEVLVIGIGSPGRMIVPFETKEAIKKAGITLISEPTEEAIKTYNELSKRKKTIAAFHLTC